MIPCHMGSIERHLSVVKRSNVETHSKKENTKIHVLSTDFFVKCVAMNV